MNQENTYVTKQELRQELNVLGEKISEKIIREIKDFTMEGFKAMDKKMEAIEARLDAKINKHDRRLDVSEHRINIVKKVIENDLEAKVAW
jgi:hypothetical protein